MKPAEPAKAAAPAATAKAATPKALADSKAVAKKPANTSAATAAKTSGKEATKESKAKKPKLVRDSFTIPKDEYAVIDILKERATSLAQPVKKSEILRAGLKVLAGLSDNALRSALQAVPSIKTGRPKADAPAESPAPAAKPSAKPARK
ncbi:hypothetical protein [Acidovorax sp.]|uniref:hypothetical protein n=1 Tax=Acidovorax sp. TaxID=1872122 RepID=UPI00391DC61D